MECTVAGRPTGFFTGSRRSPASWRALVVAMSVGATMAPAPVFGESGSAQSARHVWLDADGAPLPFQSGTEIREFLQTAPVVSRRQLDVGVNRSDQLVLERDATRMRAIFRVADIELKDTRIGARFFFRFRDSYLHECAAYELARWLGLDNVPPAVLRRIDGTEGSLQIWIENALDEESDEFSPPDVRAWVEQVWDKDVFDNLLLNVDRNAGNVLCGGHYRLWLIDHTRAFQPEDELLDPKSLARVRREIWDRLRRMTTEDLEGLVGDYLDPGQLSALATRRERLVEHVEQLIAERGERAVLY